jgi:hypothetical protein
MNITLGIIFIAFGFLLIKYREPIGDTLGEPAWSQKVGGMYNVMIILGIALFFWGLATMVGTTDILFAPITGLFKRN